MWILLCQEHPRAGDQPRSCSRIVVITALQPARLCLLLTMTYQLSGGHWSQRAAETVVACDDGSLRLACCGCDMCTFRQYLENPMPSDTPDRKARKRGVACCRDDISWCSSGNACFVHNSQMLVDCSQSHAAACRSRSGGTAYGNSTLT